MGDVVNLRTARKRLARSEAEKTAEGRRAKFGRTKAEKQRDLAEADRLRSHVDGHRRRRDDAAE